MLTLNDGRSELWQWDTGRTLAVDADCSQVHFSNKVFGRSIDVDVVGGTAIIPDILLQTDKDLNVWAFVGTAENGYTKISKTFKVNRRNKPADYVFTPADQMTLQTIQSQIGDLADLTTEAKDTLVAAINEAAASGGAGSMDLRVADGYVQYSTDGGSTWTNLIAMADLKGDTGPAGEAGGFYTPAVTQPDANTLRVAFSPSKEDMPDVEPKDITLPAGGGGGGSSIAIDETLTKSGQAADAKTVGDRLYSLSEEIANLQTSGLTTAQVKALDGMFKVAAYIKADVSTEYSAFKTAFGIEDSGDTEPEKTLTSISATYSGGDVAVGTAVTALTGITVTATYSDGSTAVVTGYTLSGTIAEGNNTITVSYGGKKTTITVTGVVEQGGGEETGISNETTWTDRVAYTYNAVENEYVETNGTITPYAKWNRTPYLYCAGASTLRVIVNISTSMMAANNSYNCFYDENKNFICSFDYSGIDYNTVGAYKDFVVPENAAYFIASHKAGVIGKLDSRIQYALGFVPYR